MTHLLQRCAERFNKLFLSSSPRPNPCTRPSLETLEDRVVPSGTALTPPAGGTAAIVSSPAGQHAAPMTVDYGNFAASTPPTSATLSWGDYKEVKASLEPPYVANTAWTDHYDVTFKNPPDYSLIQKGKVWIACVDVTATAVTASVIFDAANSWVVTGKQTDALLAHETLHLQIAEYICQEAQQRINAKLPLVGSATATNANPQKALDEAVKLATAKVNSQIKAWFKEWDQFDKAAQSAYDTATKHGTITTAQADWQTNYQSDADKSLPKAWK